MPPPAVPPVSIGPDDRFGGQLTITWPGNPFDILLESSDSLSDRNWYPALDPVLPLEDGLAVPLAPDGTERYFRLRRP